MTFKEFLKQKGISESDFANKSAEDTATLQNEYNEAVRKELNEKIEKAATKAELESIEKQIKELEKSEFVSKIQKDLEEAMEQIQQLKEKGFPGTGYESPIEQISKFLKDNHEQIKTMKSSGSGLLEFEVKAPALMTTANATNPDGIPTIAGVQMAPPSNVNLRGTAILSRATTLKTSLAAYPYTETVPKDGNYEFVAEGAVKPQIDFNIETRYAQPKKIAAWIKLTDESVQDIPGLESIAKDLLLKKHNLKKEKAVLFGTGTGQEPTGATVYGRTFVAGAMALAVTNPNFMDVVNAALTDIFTTHNYEDEMSYVANLVVINPIDFFLNLTAAKDGEGKPLYPTASLFNVVQIGGMTIIPDESIPVGKIFVADMSKYNVTDYIGYTVKIGWVNDDFIRNQFVILGESRFHAFVKRLDQQAFIYDDIDTIKTAITAA